jgi:predicted dehydrogenase
MDSRVKVGISGLGRSGWNIHAKLFESLSDKYSVVAVADPIEERRREAAAKFRCKAYSEYEQLISDDEVELVVVATPSHLHSSQTIMALEAGKNVVCEKPMAATITEADEMISAAEKTGNFLSVFHNSLFAPDYMKVKEIIKSGKLGRVILVKIYNHSFSRRWDWQTLRKFGGGELRNNGVHSIVQGLQIIGSKELEVFCDLKRALTLGDAEDHVKILLKAPGSPLVDIEVTRACAYPQEKWLVMGTQGGLAGTSSLLRWRYFDPNDLPPRQVEVEPVPDRSYNVDNIMWIEENYAINVSYQSSGLLFYEELYKTLLYGGPPPVPLDLARGVMWVVEKCFELCGMQT